MRGVAGEAVSYVKTPEGNANARSVYKIQDPKRFRVDFLAVKELPSTAMLLANGTTKREITLGEPVKSLAVGARSPVAQLPPSKMLERWPREFSRLMFLNLTDGADAWTPVLSALSRGEEGFRTSVEERTVPFRGKQVKSVRVRAVRNAEAAKRLGACEMEMVFDAERYLPVTVRVISSDTKGKPWQLQWSAGWNFNQKFHPEEFERVE